MRTRSSRTETFLIALIAVLMIMGAVAVCWLVGASIVYFAFNLVLVPIFGLSELSFLQAWLLMLLLGLVGGCFKVVASRG